MLNPDLREVLKNRTSRYSLVIATAKRARELSEEAEENHEIRMTCVYSVYHTLYMCSADN